MQTRVTITATFEHPNGYPDWPTLRAGLTAGLKDAFQDDIKLIDEYGADGRLLLEIEPYEKSAFGFNAQDVIEHAEENGYGIDEDDADEILDRMLSKGDVSVGISWDTVLYFIEEHVKIEKEHKRIEKLDKARRKR